MKLTALVSTLFVLVAIAACGGSSATPAPVASGAASAATPITVRDFKFDQANVTVHGRTALAVTNAGPTVHDLTVRDASGKVLGETADLKPGTSETLILDLPTGSYTIFCSLPGHESLGIKGTLTVAP